MSNYTTLSLAGVVVGSQGVPGGGTGRNERHWRKRKGKNLGSTGDGEREGKKLQQVFCCTAEN